MGVALQQLFHELLQSSEVALTLPRVVVRALREDGQTFSPCRGQFIKLLHHDRRDELVRETGHKQRGHAAQRHLPIGQELIPVAPQGQQTHGQEGEESRCHVGDAEEGVFDDNGGDAVRVDRCQAHCHGAPQRAAKQHHLCLVKIGTRHDIVQRGLCIEVQPVLAGLPLALPIAAVIHEHHVSFQIDQHQQGVRYPVTNIASVTVEINNGGRSRRGAALIPRGTSRRLPSGVAEKNEVELHAVLGANVNVLVRDSCWHGNIKARGRGLIGKVEEHILKFVEDPCHRGQDESQEKESSVQVISKNEGQQGDSTGAPGPRNQCQSTTLDCPPQSPGLLHGYTRAELQNTHSVNRHSRQGEDCVLIQLHFNKTEEDWVNLHHYTSIG